MKTARKAVRLLRAFSRQEPELGVNELARRLDLDPATVHRLLRTMQAEGFIEQDEASRKYRLGLGVLELASGLLQQRGIVGVAMPYLEELHSKTEETVILDAFNGTEVVCLAALNSPQEVRTTSFVGERAPAYCTSAGQIFLAYMTPTERWAHLPRDLAPLTPKTVVDPVQLNRILREIARTGIAVSDESCHRGVRGISAPVFGAGMQVTATISVTVPKQRLTLKQMASLSKLVRSTASAFSDTLKRLDPHGSLRPASERSLNR
jgi:IclR family KDG regulon transcriptional repressor